MRRALALGLLLALPALAGCAAGPRPRADVVASFYPMGYLAQRIAGDHLAVRTLVPPDVEPHDYDLKPSDEAALEHARLVVFAGRGLEPFVDRASRNARDAGAEVVVAGEAVMEEGDPHAWIDPAAAQGMARAIAAAMSRVDPANATSYQSNLDALLADLRAIDAEYGAGLARCERRAIVTTHAAFGYLARHYGFEQLAVSGVSPEAEPSAQTLREIAQAARAANVTTIFFESLVSPAFAKALAREVPGARTDVLDPLEGVEEGSGEDYLSLMRGNLNHLRAAMGCA